MNRRKLFIGSFVIASGLGVTCSLIALASDNYLPFWAAQTISATLIATVLIVARLYDAKRVSLPINRIRRQLRGAVARIVKMEAIAETQRKLDDNLSRLRELVYGYGDPGVVDGTLCFGGVRIDADNSVVDRVQSEFGGAATIFCGDTRISTNVKDSEGRRAIRSLLGKGAAHTALYEAGTSYRGEVVLFDEPYVAIYEPIISGTAVVGALFVAVQTKDVVCANPAEIGGAGTDWLTDMPVLLDTLETTIKNRYEAVRDANLQRSEALDARRKIKALERDQAVRQAAQARIMHGDTATLAQDLDDLSARTEQQAAALEETTTSLAFVTEAVRETAISVETANRVAAGVSSEADRSSEVVRSTIAAMGKIDSSSAEIAQVVGVIDQIAAQTNLLALNAAIEAAQAGDAGRGFSVIAAEVRTLAQGSAEAAKTVKDLVRTSSAHVTNGVKLVDMTGRALETIVSKTHQLKAIMDSISLSAKDQSSSLQEIYRTIESLDKVTQQNAAMVENSKDATGKVAVQSARLRRLADQSVPQGLPVVQAMDASRASDRAMKEKLRNQGRP